MPAPERRAIEILVAASYVVTKVSGSLGLSISL